MFDIIPVKVGECYNEGPRVFYLGDCNEKINLYNIFWVLKSDSEIILVDTGFDNEFAVKYMPGIKQRKDEDPLKQLKSLGIDPLEIKKVVLTHAHFDHLSPTVFRYKNADIFIQQKELDYILNPPHPWFNEFIDINTAKKLFDVQKFKTISGDVSICDGIKVIYTGGHSPGHQSVMVNTKEGDIILAGDLAFTYENLEKDVPVGFNCNLEECFSSMKKIRSFNCKIIPGHDSKIFTENF